MKRLWMGCLALALSWTAQVASAQENKWLTTPAPAPAPSNLGVNLRPPEPLPWSDPALKPAGFTQDEVPGFRLTGAQDPDPLYGSSNFQPVPPPPPPPPGLGLPSNVPNDEKFNCAVKANSSSGQGFWDQTREGITGIPQAIGIQGGGRSLFQSDHCFDNFSSPVTNPFYFEDPRSLTEIKPLVIYQRVPGSNYAFQGGDIWFYGVQGSVAVTDWFSVTLNKLGAVTISPSTHAYGIGSDTGFAEVALGPKFTFLRIEQTKTILAAGLIFDLPIGSGTVFQNTGDLSLIPYISFGQNFFKSCYGSFNFLNTTGYSFATDNVRTDFLYSSFHLDYDVLNYNKIFPLIEMNYFHYTTNGNSPPVFGFEGRDIIDFGAGGVAGQNDLTIAVGLRYKFAEWFQIGFAAEFPLLNNETVMSYRLGFDLIFRY